MQTRHTPERNPFHIKKEILSGVNIHIDEKEPVRKNASDSASWILLLLYRSISFSLSYATDSSVVTNWRASDYYKIETVLSARRVERVSRQFLLVRNS